MEILGARPVWSMSDSEKLSTLDAVVAEKARLETLGQQLIADLDRSGYAKELGAGDTARLMSQRYRQDLRQTRRDVRVANLLTAYPATRAALPDPSIPFPNPAHAATAADTAESPEGADVTGGPEGAGSAEDADGSRGAEGSGGADGVLDGPAVASGWRVSPAQAAVIVAMLDKVPSTAPPENLAVAEQELIGLAATHTPSELRSAGKVICDLLDPDGPEPSEKAAYARESLTLKPAERGVTFHGYLANENAELFRTLIHTHARPHKTIDGDPDPRPHTKRQADALTTVLTATGQTHGPNCTTPTGTTPTCTTPTGTTPTGAMSASAAGTGDGEVLPFPLDRLAGRPAPDGAAAVTSASAANTTGADTGIGTAAGGRGVEPGHGVKPHISITVDYNDLVTATANATGALTFGDRLSAATIRRLACDADILPIVLGSRSQPLDVGTTQRLVTRPIRRALNARDKGCVVCGAPPSRCEAHHLRHWADGGITAVSNLALVCKRHHQDLHAGHWQIRILDGVVHVTRPTWADPTHIPPGRYRPPIAHITHYPTPNSHDLWGDHPTPAPTPTTKPPPPANPWGDDDMPTPPASAAPAAPQNPWGDDEVPVPPTKPPVPVPQDPWGDGVPAPPTSTPPTPFNPWGDDTADAS